MSLRASRVPHVSPLLVLLLVVFVHWTVYLVSSFDRFTRAWCMIHPDTMHTLLFARSFAHGHPLRFSPQEPPSTMHSDLLSPVLYSVGYWLGFRGLSSFVLWANVVCLLVSLGATWALWVFFRRLSPAVAFPTVLCSMVFPGVFSNVFSSNFGFFFLFFWAALANLGRPWRFVAFATLAGLCRPEGLLAYAFLVCCWYASEGQGRWALAAGLPALCVPPLVFFLVSGSPIPQGVAPQNILHYQGLLGSLYLAGSTFTDQLKGALLGWYPSGTKIGFEGTGWLGTLPPFVFLMSMAGLFLHRPRWAPGILGYLVLLVLGDSFTYFSGIHLNRHLHILSPFLFGFAFLFLQHARVRGESLFPLGFGFVVVMVGLQALGVLAVNETTVVGIGVDKEIADYVRTHHPHQEGLDQRGGARYWLDGAVRWHSLSVGDNPVLGRYVRRHMRVLETSEYLQAALPDTVLYVSYGTGDLFESWLRQFRIDSLATFSRNFVPVALLGRLDLGRLRDKPPRPHPFDELDVGDPLSEHLHGYRFRHSLERPAGGFLQEGEGFWDGGRPSVIREEFHLDVPGGGGVLAVRTKGVISGHILELLEKRPVDLRVDTAQVRITANGTLVADTSLALPEGFAHLFVPVPFGGRVRFRVEGLLHSFHYWTFADTTSPSAG